ncbi:hypothetical protein [Hyphomicrobium sp. ghe19]|uniref:hypothetical protein n=1 Tax=Hyphomicrobium sp. ghe19 TaxID=2682968 RepID=UPI0013678366|nr:hypothetical protein HYPP_01329 [Hyphomicrobium sp. ghe19]
MNTRKNLKIDLKDLRFLVRNLGIFAFLVRNHSKPADVLFKVAWKKLDRSGSALAANNFRQIPARNIQHRKLRQVFKHLFPGFSPEITLSDPSIINELRSRQSIIAMIHTQGEYAILAALDRAGLRSAMITASPINNTRLANYGVRNAPLNILRTSSTFVEARAALRDGYTLVCDVDYVPDKKSANADRYISTPLFDFQRLVRADLYFAHIRIGEEGEMECVVERAPGNDNLNGSVALTAAQFIEFIDKLQDKPSKLKVGDWSTHMGPKSGSRQHGQASASVSKKAPSASTIQSRGEHD